MDASEDFDDFDDGESSGRAQEKLRVFLLDLLGRWYWIVLFMVIGVFFSAYYLSKTPKTYQATATLLIKEKTSSLMPGNLAADIDAGGAEGLNTVAERILRLDLLEKVAAREEIRSLPGIIPPPVDYLPDWLADSMGTKKNPETAVSPPPPADELAGAISSWLEVSIRDGTRLLDISISHPVPEVTKAVADALALEYLSDTASSKIQGSNSSIGVLQAQADDARTNLHTARGSLSSYSRAIEVSQKVDAKEQEVADLRLRYLPKHPKFITAEAELANLRTQFMREYEVAKTTKDEKEYWEGVGSSMPDEKTDADSYFRAARQQLLSRIGVLNSEIESATSVFNSMLTRIEEVSVNQESTNATAEVSNLARVPKRPSGPNPKIIAGIGVAGGSGVGLLLALLLARLDNKFHTVSQITAETGGVILAAISDINPRHLALAEKEFLKRHPEDEQEFHKKWDAHVIFRRGASATSYAEMYRVLRASVTLLGDESKRKITLFSSALPGEGKTMTSANFALAAAGQGRKTILIDLDLRKPAVHKVFGLTREQKEHHGITECLANQARLADVIIRKTGVTNFHLVLSGKRAPNPGELLNTGRLNAILSEACAEYDVVVLDTAPLLSVPDTRVIAPLAHNFCLVCRAEYVPKGAVRHVLGILEEDGTPISGIVFNGYKEKRSLIGANNSYGYYKTSRYGRSYSYSYGSYGSDRDD